MNEVSKNQMLNESNTHTHTVTQKQAGRLTGWLASRHTHVKNTSCHQLTIQND